MERLTARVKLQPSPEQLLDMFCRDCRLRGISEKSIIGYMSCLSIFLKFLEKKAVTPVEVDSHVLREFLSYLVQGRKVKHKTVKEYFSALSAFYDYLAFEGLASSNIVLPFRKRYLRRYKDDYADPQRRLLSVEEMSRLVNSIMDPRDRAIAVLLAKTGIRRGELLRIDVEDINWEDYSIILKPTPKRSNRTVFFDDECATALRRWLKVREKLNPRSKALFISYNTLGRLSRNGVYNAVVKYARRLGFHNPERRMCPEIFPPFIA